MTGREGCSDVALIAFGDKTDGQCADGNGGYDTAQPVVTLNRGIQTAAYATDTNGKCKQHTAQAFNKDKGIDPFLLGSALFCLNMGLLKYPIHPIRAKMVQSFDTGNRNERRIGMIILNQHLAGTGFNVCGSLTTHRVLTRRAYRDQSRQSHRATGRHRGQSRRAVARDTRVG